MATATLAARATVHVGAHREDEQPRGGVSVGGFVGRDRRIVGRHDGGVVQARGV